MDFTDAICLNCCNFPNKQNAYDSHFLNLDRSTQLCVVWEENSLQQYVVEE